MRLKRKGPESRAVVSRLGADDQVIVVVEADGPRLKVPNAVARRSVMPYCANASSSFFDPELVQIVVVGLLGDRWLPAESGVR